MPCRDYYDDHPEQYFKDVTEPALKKQISFAESALCAALAALVKCDQSCSQVDADPLRWMDFKGAGITKAELNVWWAKHKELDAKHRAEEAERLRIAEIKKSAMKKLTAEEKKVLGVK